MANTLTLSEFKNILKYIMINNAALRKEGKKPTAIGLEGACGIGKTESIRSVANEMGKTLIYLNLAEIEEIGDMTGFPIKQYKINKLDVDRNVVDTIWANADTIQCYLNSSCADYVLTEDSRMAYATPAWLPKESNPNGTILLLDDYTRAGSQFMQATMSLINDGKYISWELPENTDIILTTNPDDGQYSVTPLDTAQKT